MTDEILTVGSMCKVGEFLEASRIVNYLKNIYPAYRWTACVDKAGGVIKIAEINLMQTNLPFIIRIDEVKHSQKYFQKQLMRAAGEILERYGLARDERNPRKVEEVMDSMPTDYKGNFLFDPQGVPNWIGERNKT